MRRSLMILVWILPLLAHASEIEQERERMEALTKGLTQGAAIELRTLEIRARIYEPSVIYILDRARLEVGFDEQETQFKPRISKPILENRF